MEMKPELEETGTCLLIIEQNEHLVDVLTALIFGGLGGHHGKELLEVDLSASILVEVSDHLIDGGVLGFDTERGHGGLEL